MNHTKGEPGLRRVRSLKIWPYEYKECYQDGDDFNIYCSSETSKLGVDYSFKFGPFDDCPLADCPKCPPSRTCDPKFPNGCKDNDCATESEWKDGCAKCLCYENGNESWCDGRNNAQNDFDWWLKEGDPEYKNRKCNTTYSFNDFDFTCHHDWQCDKGYECRYQTDLGFTEKYCILNLD